MRHLIFVSDTDFFPITRYGLRASMNYCHIRTVSRELTGPASFVGGSVGSPSPRAGENI
ncbi:MAG: hypothetical protein RL173_496 [Fibrobacterota bacterium]|jgi:hypothetical protein